MSKIAGIVGAYRFHNFGDDLMGMLLGLHLKKAGYDRILMHDLALPNAAMIGAERSSVAGIITRADLVCIGGGHILGDGGHVPNDHYHKLILACSLVRKLIGRETVMAGVGAGPLAMRTSRYYSTITASLVSRIGVRDRESLDFVQHQLLRTPSGKVCPGADVALLWPKDFPVSSDRRCRRIGIQLDPMDLPWPDWLTDCLARFAGSGTELVYLSNGALPTTAEKKLSLSGKSLRYGRMDHFLEELVQCSAIVTSHLHLAIAAYAARIPTVSLAVNAKTMRFYRQIGHPERCLPLEGIERNAANGVLRLAATMVWTEADEVRLLALQHEAEAMLQAVIGPKQFQLRS